MTCARSPGRGAAAVLAALLYVGTAAAMPTLHASLERVSSAPAVESGHTDACPIIHNDTSCPTCGHSRIPAARLAPAAGDVASLRLRPTARAASARTRRSGTPPNAVRAPPSDQSG